MNNDLLNNYPIQGNTNPYIVSINQVTKTLIEPQFQRLFQIRRKRTNKNHSCQSQSYNKKIILEQTSNISKYMQSDIPAYDRSLLKNLHRELWPIQVEKHIYKSNQISKEPTNYKPIPERTTNMNLPIIDLNRKEKLINEKPISLKVPGYITSIEDTQRKSLEYNLQSYNKDPQYSQIGIKEFLLINKNKKDPMKFSK